MIIWNQVKDNVKSEVVSEVANVESEEAIEQANRFVDYNTGVLSDEQVKAGYIFKNTLHTENIEVKDEIRQGGFVWKVRKNGNYGLSWKGVEA